MAEQVGMTEENKKTIITFIIGLVVGGLLVFVFANPGEDRAASVTNNDTNNANDVVDDNGANDDIETAPTNNNNNGGAVTVNNQPAGTRVEFSNINFPTDEGWVGIRDYRDGEVGAILGVARWNRADGLLPVGVNLLRPTISGNTYAVVFFNMEGGRQFNAAINTQMGGVVDTFQAQ